jgi:dTDP-4-dehydrorhamnose reductase
MADEKVHILVTGGTGQIGTELRKAAWPSNIRLHAPTRAELDLTDPAAIASVFAATSFSAVVNAAAFTAVDDAEDAVGEAFAVNALGPALLADATRRTGAVLIHISTDYVFDGSIATAYVETDAVAPPGVYGASKLAGELAVAAGNPRSMILRTAWVFSAHGRNFVKTMLRIGTGGSRVRVVADQRGCPTSAADVAGALVAVTLRLVEDKDAPKGVYHFVNGGDASWHGFAEAIFEAEGELPRPQVTAIRTQDYPTKARRPANSRLSTARLTRDFGIVPRPWSEALADVIAELKQETST